MTENYYRRQELAQRVINSYQVGRAVFDTAFRAAYNAAVHYNSDPEVVGVLDQTIGSIQVGSVQEEVSGRLLVKGTTQYSPASNHEGRIEPDAVLWMPPASWNGGDTIDAPLAAGCHPFPRHVFAELLIDDYVEGLGSFGPAFRAAYEAVAAMHNRVDRLWQLRTARFSLGKVVISHIEPGVQENGKQEIEVCSEQTIRCTETGETEMEADTRLYVDPARVPWATIRQAVGEAIYPLDVLSPHHMTINDNLIALRRAIKPSDILADNSAGFADIDSTLTQDFDGIIDNPDDG